MNQETEDISKMLNEVGVTAKIVGISQLTEILKYIQKTHQDISEKDYENAKNVIVITCKHYDMTFEDFYSKKRKNERRYALATVCYILNKDYNFNLDKISFIVKKSIFFVSILINEIGDMNKKHPVDLKILNKLEKILLEI
jgi:chromosomal replication initiation ATPase DnaA